MDDSSSVIVLDGPTHCSDVGSVVEVATDSFYSSADAFGSSNVVLA